MDEQRLLQYVSFHLAFVHHLLNFFKTDKRPSIVGGRDKYDSIYATDYGILEFNNIEARHEIGFNYVSFFFVDLGCNETIPTRAPTPTSTPTPTPTPTPKPTPANSTCGVIKVFPNAYLTLNEDKTYYETTQLIHKAQRVRFDSTHSTPYFTIYIDGPSQYPTLGLVSSENTIGKSNATDDILFFAQTEETTGSAYPALKDSSMGQVNQLETLLSFFI